MIVGNGMLANAFNQYINDDKIIIFASGVSNSKEQNDKEFEREFELLKSFSVTHKKLVYFSTCSIFDESLLASKYIKHKIKTETFIEKSFKNYLILRLPNVVGKTNNANTSFNYFKNKILKGERLELQENATRYFIDIDDLAAILPYIISDEKEFNKSINICFNNKINVINLVLLLESFLETRIDKSPIEGGKDYNVDNLYFMNIVGDKKIKINKEYNNNLIKKYLKTNYGNNYLHRNI